jgi:predicted nucleic-acid-binding Zn-ribbon protein
VAAVAAAQASKDLQDGDPERLAYSAGPGYVDELMTWRQATSVFDALFARQFRRTCNECGYSWLVPRSIARRGIRGMSAASVAGSAREATLTGASADLGAGIEARAEVMESYRICAKCGVDDFSQLPARRGR